MAIPAVLHRNPNVLCLKDYPVPVSYHKKASSSKDSCICLRVTDEPSQQEFELFVSRVALRNIGLSPKMLEHLKNEPENLSKFLQLADNVKERLQVAASVVPEHLDHLAFFHKNISRAIHIISRHLFFNGKERLVREGAAPKIYFSKEQEKREVIIHLPGLEPLGSGTFGKAKMDAWLTAPDAKDILVVKKAINKDHPVDNAQHIQNEIESIKAFANQRGVIQLIGSGIFEGFPVMFMPMYEWTAWDYFFSPFPLTTNQLLAIFSQLLEGLRAVSQKGVHGDLSPANVFFRMREGNVEAVIADFGTFRRIGEEKWGDGVVCVGSPEYHLKKISSSKQDVWALGIILYQMCKGRTHLPCFASLEDCKLKAWLADLQPGWVLEDYPLDSSIPSFLQTLMSQMLDPRPEHRPSAEEVFQLFSEGQAAFLAAQDQTSRGTKRKSCVEDEPENYNRVCT